MGEGKGLLTRVMPQTFTSGSTAVAKTRAAFNF